MVLNLARFDCIWRMFMYDLVKLCNSSAKDCYHIIFDRERPTLNSHSRDQGLPPALKLAVVKLMIEGLLN